MDREQKVIDGLLTILCDLEVVSRDDKEELQREFERSEIVRFEDYLIDEEIVEKEDLLRALQQYYKVTAVDVLGEMFDHNLLTMFPQDVLVRNCAIPYRQDDDILVMIVANPNDENLDAVLGEFVSYDFEYFVGIPRHIEMMIKDFYQKEMYKEDFEDIIDEEAREREVVHIDEDEVMHLDEAGKDDE